MDQIVAICCSYSNALLTVIMGDNLRCAYHDHVTVAIVTLYSP